jgi:hypothetical protein
VLECMPWICWGADRVTSHLEKKRALRWSVGRMDGSWIAIQCAIDRLRQQQILKRGCKNSNGECTEKCTPGYSLWRESRRFRIGVETSPEESLQFLYLGRTTERLFARCDSRGRRETSYASCKFDWHHVFIAIGH